MDFYDSVIECADQMSGVSSQSALCRLVICESGIPCMILCLPKAFENILIVSNIHDFIVKTKHFLMWEIQIYTHYLHVKITI